MAPRKIKKEKIIKRQTVRTTIEFKKEIISMLESGARAKDITLEYGMPRSTISTILKNKEAIKKANVAKGVTCLSVQRSQTIEEMEKLLLVWISQQYLSGDSIPESRICEKARQLHCDLKKELPGNSNESEFKASRGWFDKFKRRSGIHSVVRHEEAINFNKESTRNVVDDFRTFVDSEGFVPEQVFYCDETGLFWKKMPKRTFITREEAALPGHKPMKDRLTLVLCGNVTSDCKIKPLLVYHSENPRAFKKNCVRPNNLSVMWRANKKAFVTKQFFLEWIDEVFAPSVQVYLESNNLPFKALLVMGSVLAHRQLLWGEITNIHSFITVKLLPSNTTPLTQPMDQHVFSTFKKLYTKYLFQKCFELTSGTELSLRDFWKNHFNILHCLKIIDKAWGEVSLSTLNSIWGNLWPDCEMSSSCEVDSVITEILSLGKSMGLDVSSEDIKELIEDHRNELTTAELQDLHNEQQEELTEELSSQGDKDSRNCKISTAELKHLFSSWSTTQNILKKWHPDIALVNRNVNELNNSVIRYFRKVRRSRQQRSL